MKFASVSLVECVRALRVNSDPYVAIVSKLSCDRDSSFVQFECEELTDLQYWSGEGQHIDRNR